MKKQLLFFGVLLSITTANASMYPELRLLCEADQVNTIGDISAEVYTSGSDNGETSNADIMLRLGVLGEGDSLQLLADGTEDGATLSLEYDGVKSVFSTQQEASDGKEILVLKVSPKIEKALSSFYTPEGVRKAVSSGLHFECKSQIQE